MDSFDQAAKFSPVAVVQHDKDADVTRGNEASMKRDPLWIMTRAEIAGLQAKVKRAQEVLESTRTVADQRAREIEALREIIESLRGLLEQQRQHSKDLLAELNYLKSNTGTEI